LGLGNNPYLTYPLPAIIMFIKLLLSISLYIQVAIFFIFFGSPWNSLSFFFQEKLLAVVLGLLRQKKADFLSLYKTEAFTIIKKTIKQVSSGCQPEIKILFCLLIILSLGLFCVKSAMTGAFSMLFSILACKRKWKYLRINLLKSL